MISFGLTFLFVNLLYLFFSIAAGFIAYKVLTKKELLTIRKRKWLSVGVFAFVLILPFYDLLLQKAVKTYYQAFKMNGTIYAYPEKDADGKIESLGVGSVGMYTLSRFTKHLEYQNFDFKNFDVEKMKVPKKSFWGWYENNIRNYIEIGIFDDFDNVKLFRITYDLDFDIKPIASQTARYQVDGYSKYALFGLYRKSFMEFKDTQKDEVIATAWHLYFPPAEKDKFRNRYLGWRGPSGDAFSIENIGTTYKTFEEIFGFPAPVSVNDIKYNSNGEGKL